MGSGSLWDNPTSFPVVAILLMRSVGCVVCKATVCVVYETKRVDICCRVNADEPGKEPTAVEYLWAHLSGLIIVVEQFLQTWPGLFYKVCTTT